MGTTIGNIKVLAAVVAPIDATILKKPFKLQSTTIIFKVRNENPRHLINIKSHSETEIIVKQITNIFSNFFELIYIEK